MTPHDAQQDAICTETGRGARVRIALALDDPVLQTRVMATAAQSSDFVVVEEIAGADIVVADTALRSVVPVLVIGGQSIVEASMRAGAAGGLPLSFTPVQLRIAIEAIANGLSCRARVLPSDVTPKSLVDDGDSAGDGVNERRLTERETDVLALLITGASNKVIARQLEISVHTAKFHVAAIVAKLGATGRTDAVARALRDKLGMI